MSVKNIPICGMALWALGLVAVSGFAPAVIADLTLGEADNGTTVAVARGQNIFVNLPGNPSTGFSWSLSSTNGEAVVVVGDAVFTADNPELSGGGGVYQFPLRAVKIGRTTFDFSYRQAWNPQNPSKTFAVTLSVTNGAPRLTFAQKANRLWLSWPVAGNADFGLEGTADISGHQWLALNVLVASDGTNYIASLPLSGGSLFFRLRR